jgi:hypothetical protein
MMIFCFIFCILCSCSSEPEVREYRIPKSEKSLWNIPPSWNLEPQSGLRSASFMVHGDKGKLLDISVVHLEGGENHLDNINRWRKEINLMPWSQDEMQLEIFNSQYGIVNAVELIGKSEGIHVLYTESEKGFWFFKMRGDVSLIDVEKAHLLPFLESFISGCSSSCNK